MDYKTSGVDVEAGRAFIKRIRSAVEATHSSNVIGGIGGFGGFIRLPTGLAKPVLVAGSDGVGTKLDLAQEHQAHFNVGIDLVAMCVNDVITCGSEPLLFLDYIATGKLGPEAMTNVVEGIAEGCKRSSCSLLGGETAEMPGFYAEGRYDLAGFCVAVVEEDLLIDGSKIIPGDQIIGVASSGAHSNGFSLVRKVLALNKINEKTVFGNERKPVIETLLEPTLLYGHLVKGLLEQGVSVKGMAHITGGGLPENLPRCLPSGLKAVVDITTWQIPEIFRWLQIVGEIPEQDLWNTFNLGVGFCLVVPPQVVNSVLQICAEHGHDAWIMGKVDNSTGTGGNSLTGLPF